jgi:4-nitrophenyl phosphatase
VVTAPYYVKLVLFAEISDRFISLPRGLNWNKLATATLNLRRGASFIGTNSDDTFPTERGLIHGNGAILAALTTASGVSPIVIGKPEPHLYRMAMRRLGTQPSETAALGDRLETDILGAVRAGMPSILVLSGVATFADLEKATPKPTWVFAGLTELRHAWEAAL